MTPVTLMIGVCWASMHGTSGQSRSSLITVSLAHIKLSPTNTALTPWSWHSGQLIVCHVISANILLRCHLKHRKWHSCPSLCLVDVKWFPCQHGRFLLLTPMTFSPVLRARRISSACHGEIFKPVRHRENCDDGVTSQSIGQSLLNDQRCKRDITFGGWCMFNLCHKRHARSGIAEILLQATDKGIKGGRGGEGYKMYWEEPGYVFRRCASCFFWPLRHLEPAGHRSSG